jgi:hypothetical protein
VIRQKVIGLGIALVRPVQEAHRVALAGLLHCGISIRPMPARGQNQNLPVTGTCLLYWLQTLSAAPVFLSFSLQGAFGFFGLIQCGDLPETYGPQIGALQ